MTQYVDIQYIRNAIGITGTKESCKGCKYNEPEGFACNTYKAPSFAYVCEVLDDAPIVDAVPVIRCCDCVHFKYLENLQMTHCDVHDRCPDYTDFCSWAERKDNG